MWGPLRVTLLVSRSDMVFESGLPRAEAARVTLDVCKILVRA
jgi:hypothetical protein